MSQATQTTSTTTVDPFADPQDERAARKAVGKMCFAQSTLMVALDADPQYMASAARAGKPVTLGDTIRSAIVDIEAAREELLAVAARHGISA